jgi:hypothetical protein
MISLSKSTRAKNLRLTIVLALIVGTALIFSQEIAYAFRVAELPEDNLIVNPWFRSASNQNLAGFDGWTRPLTDGVTWGLSHKESNPSPNLVVIGRCGSQQVYCGTAARWAEQDGVLYPNIDVYAYQVVAADSSRRKLKFFAHYVSHRVEVGAVNVYGGPSADGPWELVWTPLYYTQDVKEVPESGGQQELWMESGFREWTIEQGYPFYKVELHARLPELVGDAIRGAGFKITGIYFATEATNDPGGEFPTPNAPTTSQPGNDQNSLTPSATAAISDTLTATPDVTPEATPRATETAGLPARLQAPRLTAEAISPTEILITFTDGPEQGRRLRLERSLNGASDWRPVASLSPDEDEYKDEGLPPDTDYYYRVRVSKEVISNIVSAQTLPELPLAAPTSLQVTAVAPQQVELSWTDQAEDESGFVIERSADGVLFVTVQIVGQDVASFVDDDLAPGTYYYRVQSYRDDTYSGFSEVVSTIVGEAAAEVEVEPVAGENPVQTDQTSSTSVFAGFALPGGANLAGVIVASLIAFITGVGLVIIWVMRRGKRATDNLDHSEHRNEQ